MTGNRLHPWIRRQFEAETVRRRTHACAIAAALAFLAATLVSLFSPGRYWVGPIAFRLDSIRNPLLELVAAIVVAAVTTRRRVHFRVTVPSRVRELWSGWSLGGKLFAVALALKLAVTVVGLARVADEHVRFRRGIATRFAEPVESVFAKKNRYRQFAYFFERARVELPDDARVLYVGRGEGQLLAYLLYPRPVFMHPDDHYRAWIGHQSGDLGRPLKDDPLFPSRVSPPVASPALEEFIRAHRLTHRVEFVQSELESCRIEAIP